MKHKNLFTLIVLTYVIVKHCDQASGWVGICVIMTSKHWMPFCNLFCSF